MFIARCAAVSAVGLTAAQTCAAFRANLSGFGDALHVLGREQPIVGAEVPAEPRLRRSAAGWLVSLALRALRECLGGIRRGELSRTAMILSVPDPYRNHPATAAGTGADLQDEIERRLDARFSLRSQTIGDGHGAAIRGLLLARELFNDADIEQCVVGGVDSLLNAADVNRLIAADRLHDEHHAQGVIPGEGAAFVLLTRRPRSDGASLAQIRGVATASEADTVLGSRRSNGVGLRAALEAALRDARQTESAVSFRVSDMNGERYRAWESLMSATRFYRSRRERLPVWYPAASLGDTGAASAAMGLVAAAWGISRGYAPGPFCMCEASSDEGLRAACVLSPAPGAPQPPFRAKQVSRAG
jgi:3-oxoacyl-[acyl-carrier-protein] synthase-1